MWAHHAWKLRNVLESGDIEEALDAAGMIGDDELRRDARGSVLPEPFTQGTSEQRARRLKLGFATGDGGRGDTFAAKRL